MATASEQVRGLEAAIMRAAARLEAETLMHLAEAVPGTPLAELEVIGEEMKRIEAQITAAIAARAPEGPDPA
jgi:hypothetical protein